MTAAEEHASSTLTPALVRARAKVLAREDRALKADLIKLPHHAITTTVPAFLDAVAPEAAVATNRQKDLDGKSINQLKSRDLPTFFYGDGTVYAVTDGTDWYLWQTEGTF